MRVIMIGLRLCATTTSGSVCAIHIRENEPTRATNTRGLVIDIMVSSLYWMEGVYATAGAKVTCSRASFNIVVRRQERSSAAIPLDGSISKVIQSGLDHRARRPKRFL